MQADRPAPGEEINRGAATVPRLAASVIILRGGAEMLELLLLQRNPAARFMGGAWVFPGGAVDPGDGEDEDARLRGAALREVAEEAGVALAGPDALVPFSRWITPPELRIRFDTHFFLAPLADRAKARADGNETVAHAWHTPAGALAAFRAGALQLVFPTLKQLEQLAGFASADALLQWARGRAIVPVQPRVDLSGETARLVLPGEPGYED